MVVPSLPATASDEVSGKYSAERIQLLGREERLDKRVSTHPGTRRMGKTSVRPPMQLDLAAAAEVE